jgi:DNA-binding XRE family transcriptional regulator
VAKLTEKIRRAARQRAAAKAVKDQHPELDVINPAVPRITAREVVEEILHPVQRNKMKARRKKLGLSQSELATVLDVDPASIYRHERDDVLPALWDYALKGIEAEATDPVARRILKGESSPSRGVIVEGLSVRGSRFTAVRIVRAQRDNVRAGRLKKKVQRAEREVGKAVVVDLPKRP